MWKPGGLTGRGVLEDDSEPPNPLALRRTQVSGLSLTRQVIAPVLTFLQQERTAPKPILRPPTVELAELPHQRALGVPSHPLTS